jgi:hypothetical protein
MPVKMLGRFPVVSDTALLGPSDQRLPVVKQELAGAKCPKDFTCR